MPRRHRHEPLRVSLNNRLVGTLSKAASGAVAFQYDETWLSWEHALPVSLSLPLREDPYRGDPVIAVFDNLLPDVEALRRRVAEKVGAAGIDAYSMLAAIGHDCVGALQFASADAPADETGKISGEPVEEDEIERMLKGLAQAPLGLSSDDPFRISIAGAQEKTALLMHEGKWIKPHGTTPTTHLLKTQIGQLPNGIDLSNSVENEFYCLKLAGAFGLPVNEAAIHKFGKIKALVIERFDRRWTADGRLLRLPQEDFCQALSIPPTRKYQSEGGPGMIDILDLLTGSDTPVEDQDNFLRAQIIYWLIGATDAHAKNFSVFLAPGGGYRLTPFYDVLTAQPSLAARQIERKQMKMAMSVGDKRHYRFDEIHGRHFVQTAKKAGISKSRIQSLLEEVAERAPKAIDAVAKTLPQRFPAEIHDAVKEAVEGRLRSLLLA